MTLSLARPISISTELIHVVESVATEVEALGIEKALADVEYLRRQKIDHAALGTGTSVRTVGSSVGSTTHSVVNNSSASIVVLRESF